MYDMPKNGILVSLDEVLCFAELILRWKHEAGQKIISEINKGTLTLYHIIKELDFDTDDPRIAIVKLFSTTGSVGFLFSNIKSFIFYLLKLKILKATTIHINYHVAKTIYHMILNYVHLTMCIL